MDTSTLWVLGYVAVVVIGCAVGCFVATAFDSDEE
jgi:hypothetical protein